MYHRILKPQEKCTYRFMLCVGAFVVVVITTLLYLFYSAFQETEYLPRMPWDMHTLVIYQRRCSLYLMVWDLLFCFVNNMINQPHTISVQDIKQLCVIHRSCVLKVGAVECPSTLHWQSIERKDIWLTIIDTW